MGVPGHFPISGIFVVNFRGIFCEVNLRVTILWYFCEVLLVAGGYMVPLAYDNGMVPRQASGNPSTERKQTSIGIDRRG